MILQTEVRGIFATNCYFYIDDATKHGFLIDPGAEADKLLKIIEREGFTIEKILLTHGHFDHIGAVNEIQSKLGVEVYMQGNGRDYVENPAWNLSEYFNLNMKLDDVTYIEDFSEIILSANRNLDLKMIPLAGHTTDSAIFYSKNDSVAFVGDSIFLNSIGRTDFPGGDEITLRKNLRDKIFTLPDDTILLSGHSDPTTVANEKNFLIF